MTAATSGSATVCSWVDEKVAWMVSTRAGRMAAWLVCLAAVGKDERSVGRKVARTAATSGSAKVCSWVDAWAGW